MNRLQYRMFLAMLKSNHTANVGEYQFSIVNRFSTIYELDQITGGKKTVLNVGTEAECIEAAKQCLEMMFNIE